MCGAKNTFCTCVSIFTCWQSWRCLQRTPLTSACEANSLRQEQVNYSADAYPHVKPTSSNAHFPSPRALLPHIHISGKKTCYNSLIERMIMKWRHKPLLQLIELKMYCFVSFASISLQFKIQACLCSCPLFCVISVGNTKKNKNCGDRLIIPLDESWIIIFFYLFIQLKSQTPLEIFGTSQVGKHCNMVRSQRGSKHCPITGIWWSSGKWSRGKKNNPSLSCLYCSQLLLRKGLIKQKATLLAAATTVET